MSHLQHSWINDNSCPRICITCVCTCMCICLYFYILFILSDFYIWFIPFLTYVTVCHIMVKVSGWSSNLTSFTRPDFLIMPFFVQRIEFLNVIFGVQFWNAFLHSPPFYHMYFFQWHSGKAGIADISYPVVPLKPSSLLSPTLSILMKPVDASRSQKSLMETFQFSSFIISIDKTSLSLSQDSNSPCHYPGSICVSSPLHPHLVRVMRIMHNANAGAALGTWLSRQCLCRDLTGAHAGLERAALGMH